MRLENKVAIVTGSGSGIGKATAELFAKEGAKVVLADFNEERIKEVAEEIKAAGGTAVAIKTDVSSQADNDAMFDLAIKEFGGYDILHINAGIMDNFSAIGHMTDETWNKVLAVNTFGPMMQMRTAVNYFEEKGKGSIVVTVSKSALGGGAAGAAYTASKFATRGLIESTAWAYAKKGIRINGMAPGAVETNIGESMKNLDPDGAKLFGQLGTTLVPRAGKAPELAEVALFLASDESSFVNGAIIPVDGGWSAY